MRSIRIKRNFRTFIMLSLVLMVVGAIVFLTWISTFGIPEYGRNYVEKELAKRGIITQIGKITYSPFRGVVLDQIHLFSKEDPLQSITYLENIVIDFDKTLLASGQFRLRKIILDGAQISLPTQQNGKKSAPLVISKIRGTLFVQEERKLEVSGLSAEFLGIKIKINTNVIGFLDQGFRSSKKQQPQLPQKLINEIARHSTGWQFDPKKAPQLLLDINLDTNDFSSLRVHYHLSSLLIKKNQYFLRDALLSGSYEQNILTIENLSARDRIGSFQANFDHNFSTKKGRINVKSNLDLPKLTHSWFNYSLSQFVEIKNKLEIQGTGSFDFSEEKLKTEFLGSLKGQKIAWKNIEVDQFETDFSWKNGDLFLDDISLSRKDGNFNGKFLLQQGKVRLAINTNIPPSVYASVLPVKELKYVLGQFGVFPASQFHANLDIGFKLGDPKSWYTKGTAKVSQSSYNGVPFKSAQCQLDLNHHKLDFTHGEAVFDYQDYSLSKIYGGAKSGTATIQRISYIHDQKRVEIKQVQGSIWAAPLIRTFAPAIADMVEVYRFHQPPQLVANGHIDITPAQDSHLEIDFQSPSPVTYELLKKDITLLYPRGKVIIGQKQVTVQNLQSVVFGGKLMSNISVIDGKKLNVNLQMDDMQLTDIVNTYGGNIKNGGIISGKTQFTSLIGQTDTINGLGELVIHDASLFSFPLLGPITRLFATIFQNKDLGQEEAHNATCTFQINNGIVQTDDFHTSTKSMLFAGNGGVDLKRDMVNFTMRVNTQGLLKLLTLPLTPLFSFIQFQGTGPVKSVEWKRVGFTEPNARQRQLLEKCE